MPYTKSLEASLQIKRSVASVLSLYLYSFHSIVVAFVLI